MKKLILAMLPVLVVTVAFIGYLENDKRSGTPIVLKVVTFDPVDLFRGDYVNLAYEIQRIGKDKSEIDFKSIENGAKVCVLLDPNTPAGVTSLVLKDNAGKDAVKICGDTSWTSTDYTDKYNNLPEEERGRIEALAYGLKDNYNYEKGEKYMLENGYKTENIRVEYPGIDKFFIPRGKGYAIDEYARKGRLSASVNVTKDGKPYLNYLMLDGEKVDFSTIEARE